MSQSPGQNQGDRSFFRRGGGVAIGCALLLVVALVLGLILVTAGDGYGGQSLIHQFLV